MRTSDLIEKALLLDPTALDQIESLAEANPALCTDIIQQWLLSIPLTNSLSLAAFFLQVLRKSMGGSRAEKWILSQWPAMPLHARLNITAGTFSPSALSTELALDLFRSPFSATKERHRIAAGLAASASARQCEELVLELLPSIGTYKDPVNQEILDRFVASAIQSFGSPPKPGQALGPSA